MRGEMRGGGGGGGGEEEERREATGDRTRERGKEEVGDRDTGSDNT